MQQVTLKISDLNINGWIAVHSGGDHSEEAMMLGCIYRAMNGVPRAGDVLTFIDSEEDAVKINENTMRVFRVAERLAKTRLLCADLSDALPSKTAAEIWERALSEQSN
jgi:hypothetical protein